METFFTADLQEERTVSKRETAVHTFSASDAKIVVNDVLKIRGFDKPTDNRIDGTELIFCACIPGKRLRIKKASAEIAVSAHRIIVETFDSRDRFDTTVCTHSATDTFFRIDLPDGRIACNFFLCREKTDATDETGSNATPAARLQQ